jgi:ABC-type bacteriocin/lantibiotic exporter with double-glycine peptidase domain
LLEYHGLREEDLIDLVQEIQWPDLEKGATMKRMEEALQKRGVHTFRLQLAVDARLDLTFPAIVHLEPRSDEIGHYVVRLPSSSDSLVPVWWGKRGVRHVSVKTLDDVSSGAILLTSLQPIDDPGAAVSQRSVLLRHSWLFPLAGIACILLTIGCVWKQLIPCSRFLLRGEEL